MSVRRTSLRILSNTFCLALFPYIALSCVFTITLILSSTLTNAIYNKAMPIFAKKSADNYCRFIMGVLIDYYPEEYKFIEQLALGNIGIDDQAIYDPQMISHLLGYGKRSPMYPPNLLIISLVSSTLNGNK